MTTLNKLRLSRVFLCGFELESVSQVSGLRSNGVEGGRDAVVLVLTAAPLLQDMEWTASLRTLANN